MEDGERDSLLKWLESSGQALEARVAREFLRARMRVTESFMYQDRLSGQQREGDLLVHCGGVKRDEPAILVVIECKHTDAKEKQWIGVRPSVQQFRPSREPTSWLSWCDGSAQETAAAQAVIIEKDLVPHAAPCTKVLTAHANNNPAYNAARQALSATHGIAPRLLTSDKLDETSLAYAVTGAAMAVVITTASLRVCKLSRSGEMLLEEVSEFDVMCEAPSGVLAPVTIMNEQAIPTFISRLKA